MSSPQLHRRDGQARSGAVEWPSILLCGGVYGAFLAVTYWHRSLPWPVFISIGALIVALQSSMQHEFIHGHPTRWRRLNRALAFVPLSLWLPFESYRRSHLVHHCDERLTDPFDDPETYYWTLEGWAGLGPIGRAYIRIHSTLAGRLLLGPGWNIARYLLEQARSVVRNDHGARRIWLSHTFGMAFVLAWVVGLCQVNLLVYLFGIVYPAASILMLRSFAEHRAEADVPERTAIVENAPILGFLFLFNNLHAAHHESPLMPWYALPAWYRTNRDRLVAQNGGLVYDGYAEVVRRYLFTPHHVSVHPSHDVASPIPPARRTRLRRLFERGSNPSSQNGASIPTRMARPAIFRRLAAKNASAVTRSVS